MTERVDVDSQTQIASITVPPGGSMAAPADRVAERYAILGMLGAGAMGTVYRARDLELDEEVALKVLNRELAAAPGMLERFKREVKLARRVTHHNVARTFDIGEHQGDRFLTMEFVEGEALASKLAREGRLPVEPTVKIVRDVCAGLAAAHAAGVLHRDLKTDNVIIASDGRAVITDFGIARAVAEGEATRTGGGFVGTPAYMAPEQVEGRDDLDARTDLYALGAMMYELLTGSLPWTGDSIFAIASARLLRPPPDPRETVPELPEAVADLVRRLMARQREDRPASADEAKAALDALAATPGTPSRPPPRGVRMRSSSTRAVAVLPMLNLGSPDDVYLTQTLTEDLVDLLSVVPELRVRPNGDASRYGRQDRDARALGRQLGVDVVVDASLRRVGDNVRIAVRLVAVQDGFQLWAKRFDRPSSDVLAVADDAAHAIAQALAAGKAPCQRAAAVDPIAQDLYLRGRYQLQRGWFESSREAVTLLEQARSRSENDPRILGSLAIAYCRLFGTNVAYPEAAKKTLELTALAQRLAPDLPEAHVATGMLHLANGEATSAIRELSRALELAPANVDALDAMGRILVELGRTQQGLELLGRAMESQPSLPLPRQGAARALALLGLWDEAYEALGPVPSHPADLPAHVLLTARFYTWQGRHAEIASLMPLIGRFESAYARSAAERYLTAMHERRLDDSQRADFAQGLSLSPDLSARRVSFNAQTRAELHIAVGQLEDAVEMIEAADAHALFDLVWLDRCPVLEPLRERPELARVRANVFRRSARALEQLGG